MTLACLAALSVLPPALFSAAEQLQKTPMLLTAMVNLCLAAAYLALWKSARHFHYRRCAVDPDVPMLPIDHAVPPRAVTP